MQLGARSLHARAHAKTASQTPHTRPSTQTIRVGTQMGHFTHLETRESKPSRQSCYLGRMGMGSACAGHHSRGAGACSRKEPARSPPRAPEDAPCTDNIRASRDAPPWSEEMAPERGCRQMSASKTGVQRLRRAHTDLNTRCKSIPAPYTT